MSVNALRVLDAVHVREHVGRDDALMAADPAIDGRLAGVVGSERSPLVAVLVEQPAQVPRAVADVDVGVVEIGDGERRPAGPLRDRLGRHRRQLHQPHRPHARERVRPESALLVDDGGHERRVEPVAGRVRAHDVAVVERILEPVDEGGPLDRRHSEHDGRPGGDHCHGQDEQQAPRSHRRRSSSTRATNASSSASEPSLTYE